MAWCPLRLLVRPQNDAVLLRSSQPHVGLGLSSGSHCEAEELYLSLCAGPSQVLVIADARPRINAMAQMVIKGGTETPANYVRDPVKEVHLEFLDVPNIHATRKTYRALAALAQRAADLGGPQTDWHTQVAQTDHLTLISNILAGEFCHR